MFEKFRGNFDGVPAIFVSGLGEYDLCDTMECGQCFRCERIEREDGYAEYMTLTRGEIICVVQRSRGELIFPGMSDGVFEEVARPYFNLDADLGAIRDGITSRTDSEWLKNAASFAGGIAILKQEPFETLVSFIISQNNNIPRIRKIVREICAEYGDNLTLKNDNKTCPLRLINDIPCKDACKKCGRCYTFPDAKSILENPEGLLPSKPGFRYGYILDAAEKVYSGEVDLDEIYGRESYAYTLERLKEIKGVGDKVASCVALFGFGNLEAFPVDVWMKRAIDTYFGGKLDPASLGPYAGVAQQYIFHYIRNTESK